MMRALARKELRELLPLLALAAIVQVIIVCSSMHVNLGIRLVTQSADLIPFVGQDAIWQVFLVGGLLAGSVGLRQTMWESNRHTWQFLLHRPLPREALFGAKLAVGAAASTLVVVVPILWYALWAASPGAHASPFFWSMTIWAWLLCALMPLVYLGAFLSGLRSARWYGSRFLPLAAALLAMFLCYGLSAALSWHVAALVAGGVVAAGYVAVILFVARTRDFS